ncbi:MAG: sulfatase-like hydrolase/transferase, partial [Desulfobacterota bacterium]|nr:sulfatase-like hydrolase/transferase [Thermodesulfobacteriota bacterium]
RFVDFHIGLIQNYLALKGLEEKSVLVITSDHGEEFGEHGQKYHAKHLYGEVLRVPLIISSPALLPTGRSIPTQIRSIDIVPTILELIGIPPLAKHQGESLLPLLNLLSAPDRPAISQIGEEAYSGEKVELISLTTEDYKLIWNKKTDTHELYCLKQDPGEEKNVAEEERDKAKELKEELKKLLQASEEEKQFRYKPKPAKITLDDDLVKRLRALGYMGG